MPLSRHGGPEARIAEIEARANAASAGPWAWSQTAEKGYGANVGAGCFAQNDTDCVTPLSGNLNDRIDDFYVEQGIAHSDHQNAASDADFIANARQDIPWLLSELRASSDREAALLASLTWALEYAEGGMVNDAPDHLCEFRFAPDRGKCTFHEQWAAARALLASSGEERKDG